MTLKQTANKKHEVVVVGAGPAGSTAAETVAAAGYDVLLLERDDYPGQFNSCGGGLAHFLVKKFKLPDSLIQKTVHRVKLNLGKTEKIYQAKQPIYASVKRTELDPFLAKRATQAGAKLRCRQKVIAYDPKSRRLTVLDRDTLSRYQVEGKIVIFADGPRTLAWRSCRIGVNNKLNTIVGIAYELNYPQNPHNTFEFYFDEKTLPYGYFWVFPTQDTLNVGIGGPISQLKNQAGTLLEEFISKREDLCGQKKVRRSSGLIPSYPASKLHAEGILVAGDAGGFVNPLTGGGLFLGMVSAKLAGQTAIKALEASRFDSAFLASYTRKIKLSPFYSGLKGFHALVTYSQWHREKFGQPILGKIFKLYSDIGNFALRRL